ncbi:DUF1778 domain-containing protein [Pseudomonas neustonica]|uniref:DUF1778 domain-containing protein n=1 Tax=Pseudomonas neustonica TaxID=2487346 RepID=A0ABX9XCQ6_9PSED|nr:MULTISPECIES: DUF1778 domain-containing protein [Pseudomonas]ROZ79946.1 DUF1778 domain-containing protein [Pseudomonas sp. SSM44]ROZ80543.1 DUF1778 domain-containing protein [Pseudomonas neustonica]|tara:strand:- start:26 stop:265 length:240 start_codon:yes stop_codon:yes gene_type:complete
MTGETSNFNIVVRSDALETIELAARLCNQSASDFMLDAAFYKAIDTLLTDKVAFLSADAYKQVCRGILSVSGTQAIPIS